MWRPIFFVFVCSLQYVSGFNQCVANKTELSCTKEIYGENSTNYDYCKIKVYPPNSQECNAMKFQYISTKPNWNIGGVTLQPYNKPSVHYSNGNSYAVNHTVLNITFTNIKWKTMKFRFQDTSRQVNHCRNIMISNDYTVDDQSILYYDCYWRLSDNKNGQSHVLDFEATSEDKNIYRGQYYFNIPSANMLSLNSTEEKWLPFIYVEILEGKLRVHVMPPPHHVKINGYLIRSITNCGSGVCSSTTATKPLTKSTDEVTHDYDYMWVNGSVKFMVTPLHDKCVKEGDSGCQSVESPVIVINGEGQMRNICIASITALIVASLFLYYVSVRLIRRYWCKDRYNLAGMEIPKPPTILVVYPSGNRLHAECVAHWVNYLRSEYGFTIMFDGDICDTPHGDPYIWANQAFSLATHIIYVVGPAVEEANFNIYDKPIISPLKDVDILLLSFIKTARTSKCPKEIVNVFFEHSNGNVPVETRLPNASFKLLRDWHKLISYLSKDLIPKKHIMRTENGRCFIEHLTRTEKMLGARKDDVIMQYEKVKNYEKKILL